MQIPSPKLFSAFLVLLVLMTVLSAATFAFLNSIPVNLNTFGRNVKLLAPELYNYNMEILSEKYPIEITPAGWVFSVLWPMIYLWNFLSACYMFASLFFKSHQNPILRVSPLLPKSFLVGWIVVFGSLIGWLFSFDREIFELSGALLLLSTFASYFCLAASYRAIHADIHYLRKNCKAMLCLVRIVVHNGLAILSSWITCASLLNINVVVIYYDSPKEAVPIQRGLISVQNSSTVMLTIALAWIIVFFMLENFVFDKYCRYTLTIYPTLVFAMSGLVVRNWRHPYETRNSVIGCVLVAVCGLAFVVKILLLIFRVNRKRRCGSIPFLLNTY